MSDVSMVLAKQGVHSKDLSFCSTDVMLKKRDVQRENFVLYFLLESR